ncbi:hypothetical protein ACFE04_010661 [Oxalis oulophora]
MSSLTSRLFLFSSSSLIRFHKTNPLHHNLSTKTNNHLRFRLYSSAAAAFDSETTIVASSTSLHPWPEWVCFVDRLKTKGYLSESVEMDETETESVYTNRTSVMDACFEFGRDRYDIFRSLSTDDIKKVVECGCPGLYRKTVNSAKRLRAYLGLDEGDVCGACNLRGSCDRAYVILKDSEMSLPRTVDIVRILMFYALDPLVLSGEGKLPPARKIADASSRNLLSQLIELSMTPVDPSLPKPVAKILAKKEKVVNFDDSDSERSRNVEMKRGDWMCSKCNFMNFARNKQCLKCKEDGPKKVESNDQEMKKGDWMCPECNFMNFSRNKQCLKCQVEGPKRLSVDEVPMKKGDWNCPQCSFMNFSSNRKCLRCQQSRPKRQLNPGEWECSACDFLNYRKNTVCLKCERPKPKTKGHDDDGDEHLWRSPC